MPIKIPDTPQIALTGSLGPRKSAEVASSKALGRVGDALYAMGGQFATKARQIERENNQKHEAEAALSFHEESTRYLMSLDNDFDEETWVSGAESVTGNLREQVLSNPNLSTKAREGIELRLRQQESDFLLKVADRAAKQIRSRALEAKLLEAEMEIKNNNLPGYNAVVDSLGDLAPPETKDRLKFEGESKVQANLIREQVFTNPKQVEEDLRSGKYDNVLDTGTKATLTRTARIESNRMRREFAAEVGFALSNGEIPSVEQINKWQEAGDIDASDASTLLRMAKSATPFEFNSKKFIGLMNDLSKYNPKQDDEAQTRLTELKTKVEMSEFTGPNKTTLRNLVDSHISGDAQQFPGVRTSAFDALDWWAREGAFGLEYDSAGDPIPESEKLSEDTQAAVMDEIDTWLRDPANAKASREDARKAADEIAQPYVDVAGAKKLMAVPPLTSVKPTPAPTEDDGLPSGLGGIDTDLFPDLSSGENLTEPTLPGLPPL